MQKLIAIYLLTVNAVAFAAYGWDKRKARKGQWRTKESTLLLMALAGGGLGSWLGMRYYRHKTRHWKFRILVPATVALWVTILAFFLGRMGHV